MNKQQTEAILRNKLRWAATSLDPEWDEEDLACLVDIRITGIDEAAAIIAYAHEEEIAKLKHDEQLAILPCGHYAAWATDRGCRACEYEEQIAHLIARADRYLPIIQVVHSQMSSEYRANVLRGWAHRISEHNAVSDWLYKLADALSSFGKQTE